jgi:hypothetical protein
MKLHYKPSTNAQPDRGSKLIAFDLEIAKPIPDGLEDWRKISPLGISCAAVTFDPRSPAIIWQGVPRITPAEAKDIVRALQHFTNAGYEIVTWNGCAFDFPVLAEESDQCPDCVKLAKNHIDLMMMVTFQKGHYLSLQKALRGAGMPGKLEKVTLSDGSVIQDMDGSKAPHLWAKGEHKVVLDYLQEDVNQLLRLARHIEKERCIRWTSNSGYPQSVQVSRLFKAYECFQFPEPDTSWMANPPSRDRFISWALPYWFE